MLKVTFLLAVEGEDAEGNEEGSWFSSEDFNLSFSATLSFAVILISNPEVISSKHLVNECLKDYKSKYLITSDILKSSAIIQHTFIIIGTLCFLLFWAIAQTKGGSKGWCKYVSTFSLFPYGIDICFAFDFVWDSFIL